MGSFSNEVNYPWVQNISQTSIKENFMRRPSMQVGAQKNFQVQNNNGMNQNQSSSVHPSNLNPNQNSNGPSINISNNISFSANNDQLLSYGGFVSLPNYLPSVKTTSNVQTSNNVQSTNVHGNILSPHNINPELNIEVESQISAEKSDGSRIYNPNIPPISPPVAHPNITLNGQAKSIKSEYPLPVPNLPSNVSFGGFSYPQTLMMDAVCNAKSQNEVPAPTELSHTLENMKEMNQNDLASLAFELQTQLAAYTKNSLWSAIQTLRNNPLCSNPVVLFAIAKRRTTNAKQQQAHSPNNSAGNPPNVGSLNAQQMNNSSMNNQQVKTEPGTYNSPSNFNSPSSNSMSSNGHQGVHPAVNGNQDQPFNSTSFLQQNNQNKGGTAYFNRTQPQVVRSLSQPQMNTPNYLTQQQKLIQQQNLQQQQTLQQQFNRQNGEKKEKEGIDAVRMATDMIEPFIQKLKSLSNNPNSSNNQSEILVALSTQLQPLLNGVCRMAAMSHPEIEKGFKVISTIFEKFESMNGLATPTPIEDDVQYVPWKDKDGKDHLGLIDQLWYIWNLLLYTSSSVLTGERYTYWNNYTSGIKLKGSQVPEIQGRKRTGSDIVTLDSDYFKLPKTEPEFS